MTFQLGPRQVGFFNRHINDRAAFSVSLFGDFGGFKVTNHRIQRRYQYRIFGL